MPIAKLSNIVALVLVLVPVVVPIVRLVFLAKPILVSSMPTDGLGLLVACLALGRPQNQHRCMLHLLYMAVRELRCIGVGKWNTRFSFKCI